MDTAERQRRRSRARSSALHALARAHRGEFARLVLAERERLGVAAILPSGRPRKGAT
jgi:hypothetical protein